MISRGNFWQATPSRLNCPAQARLSFSINRYASLDFLELARWFYDSPGGDLMDEFVFEVFITAVVRVRAETEADARQAVTSSAIAAPSAAEISLANQANFIEGKNASITEVDFSPDAHSIKLHEEAP
jgi:hypothetical protein